MMRLLGRRAHVFNRIGGSYHESVTFRLLRIGFLTVTGSHEIVEINWSAVIICDA